MNSSTIGGVHFMMYVYPCASQRKTRRRPSFAQVRPIPKREPNTMLETATSSVTDRYDNKSGITEKITDGLNTRVSIKTSSFAFTA